MKNSKLALLLAVGIASIPQPIAAFPAKVIFDSALLVGSFISTYDVKCRSAASTRGQLLTTRCYAQIGITAWLYYYTISELYKAYQKSNHEQDNITVKTAHAQN